MAQPRVQHGQILSTSANATMRRHTKTGLPKGSWKFMLPMASLLILGACAKAIRQTGEGANSWGNWNQGQVITQAPEQKQDSTNTIEKNPVALQGKALRDSLLKARINEIALEARKYKFEPTVTIVTTPVPKGGLTFEQVAKETTYMAFEQGLCGAALRGEKDNVEKYRKELICAAEKNGEPQRATEILRRFDLIMGQETRLQSLAAPDVRSLRHYVPLAKFINVDSVFVLGVDKDMWRWFWLSTEDGASPFGLPKKVVDSYSPEDRQELMRRWENAKIELRVAFLSDKGATPFNALNVHTPEEVKGLLQKWQERKEAEKEFRERKEPQRVIIQ